MKYELRETQRQAVESLSNNWSFVRKPAGTGKSFVVAGIATKYQQLGIKKIIVLQPNAIILQQNYEKYTLYAKQYGLAKASKFSASAKEKSLEGDVIFATIGSIYNEKVIAELKESGIYGKNAVLVVDECHLVGKNTQHTKFAKALGSKEGLKVFGLTATPYRLTDNGNEFITTSKESPFEEMTYCYQIAQAIQDKVWSETKFVRRTSNSFQSQKINKRGMDINDDEMHCQNLQFDNYGKAIDDLKKVCHEPSLIFLPSIQSVENFILQCQKANIKCVGITSQMTAKDRQKNIEDFTAGRVNVLANVGVLTCGFDYPNLRNIFCLRFTYSLSLIEQIIGRGVRIANDKSFCRFFDYVGICDYYGDLTKLLITGTNTRDKAVCTEKRFIVPPTFKELSKLKEYVNGKAEQNFKGATLTNFKTLKSVLSHKQPEMEMSSPNKMWHQETDARCYEYFTLMKNSRTFQQNEALYKYIENRSNKHEKDISFRKRNNLIFQKKQAKF